MDFETSVCWDGKPAPEQERARLRLEARGGDLILNVRAPFYGDPPPSSPAGPCWGLWEFEVVEFFIVGQGDAYTEIELGPHGHHLVLRFVERRKPESRELPIDYRAKIHGGFWEGIAHIPQEYLPLGPYRANAYAIHGQGEARRYLAAYPPLGERPDFHRLECFKPLMF